MEDWERNGEVIRSCTLLTTEANELMRPIHNRMPVILHREDFERWLDPSVQDGSKVQYLLGPYPDAEMIAVPVSTWVNDPRHEDERCVQKVA